MNNEIRAKYNEVYLLPPAVEEWVPADHPARFIRQIVESLDLDEMGFKCRKSEVGNPSFSADLMLKAWLYGLMKGIKSSRKMEAACLDSIALVWLTGNKAPDHNTFWRFYQDNKGTFKTLFRKTARIAVDSGLVGMVLHAVDGTKIQALPSPVRGQRRDKLTKLLKELDESIDKMFEEMESNEAQESGEMRLPEELRDAAVLKQRIEEALHEMDEAGVNHLHPDDPDARMIKLKGRDEFCYNAQAVVDSESGIIVAEDVVSECNDNGLMNRMLDEVEENLGDLAMESVADAGYFSARDLEEAEKRDRNVLVNMENLRSGDGEGEFRAAKFNFDEERDCVVCPLGQDLPFVGTSPGNKGSREDRYRVYRCKKRDCPSRLQCTKNKQGRSIKIGKHHAAMVRQREKQRDSEMRRLLAARKTIVEPVFGIIKEVFGLRRWSVIGIEKVRAVWSLICTAFNLKKMYRFWIRGKLNLSAG
ncbi:MAG: IS1182 family transposase [bacterium]|nr:IS1182 family transposase [bacterium]